MGGSMVNRFKNLSIRLKLICGFGVAGCLCLIITVISFVGMNRLSDKTEFVYKTNLIPVMTLSELRANILRRSNAVLWHLQANDAASMKAQEQRIAEFDKKIDELVAKYEPAIVADHERKLFDQMKAVLPETHELRNRVLAFSREYRKDAAVELQRGELAEKFKVLNEALDGLVLENEKQAEESYASSQSLSTTLNAIMTVLSLGGILIGLLTVWFVSKLIVDNLTNVLEAAHHLQNGDLAYRSTVTAQDEIGKLAAAFNHMADRLNEMVHNQELEIAKKTAEVAGLINAISKSQAVIEFNLDGTVITANDNFQKTLGYGLDEIKGRHHRIFCDPDYVNSGEYQAFWQKLNRGEFDAGVYPRRCKDGREIWIQASYNPILDQAGKVVKVTKFASDITAQKVAAIESDGILKAVDRGQAVIEFNMDGTVRSANSIFLGAVGYSLDEIKGRHHRIFCDPDYANSGEYQAFWQKLNRGEFDAGVYRRLGKGGKEIWIQASYNPIFDLKGKPYKVVKFATDITGQKQVAAAMERLVAEAQGVLGRLAANDLTLEMTETYAGELDTIKTSINAVVHNLTRTIRTVREAVESVTSGSEEIAKGNEDLSQRTSEQASALEETSASMEQMTSTVKQNADNAKQANQLAANAREIADKGGTVTKKAVDAMGEINKSSSKIAEIITVIDEIAFQTNLLALNAAVEAARAGEHGRGFAVVAAEVRNLAQRSATAAKEIKGLINESIQRVTDGSELVNQSGKTLEEIVNAVKRVSDIIAEISAASNEQASGIDQVNKAIMSMDETTQQNAALVEETTSAAQSMKEQAKELMRQVDTFKVSGADRASSMKPSSLSPHSAVATLPKVAAKKPAVGKTAAHPEPVAAGGSKTQLGGDEFEEF